MHTSLKTLFDLLKRLEYRLAFIAAGGGVGLFDLFKIPGSGQVMTEAGMLYDPASFARFLDADITWKYVSQQMADRMRQTLVTKANAELCFALTCALVSDRKRRSPDQAYLSIALEEQPVHHHFLIPKGNREEQDRFVTGSVCERIIEYLGQVS